MYRCEWGRLKCRERQIKPATGYSVGGMADGYWVRRLGRVEELRHVSLRYVREGRMIFKSADSTTAVKG
jgi:hypothetical protein